MPPEAGVLDSVSSVSAMAVVCCGLCAEKRESGEVVAERRESFKNCRELWNYKDVSRDFGGVRSNKSTASLSLERYSLAWGE